MQNKIVIQYLNKKVVKGFTSDFLPNKNIFHMEEKDTRKFMEVDVTKLKGIFFVKSYEGNKNYREKMDIERAGLGKKIKIKFKDGETIIGYTTGFSRDRTGFYCFPVDPDSNTIKIFVVIDATKEIVFI